MQEEVEYKSPYACFYLEGIVEGLEMEKVNGKRAYFDVEMSGQRLHSDSVTLDSAFMEVYGVPYTQFSTFSATKYAYELNRAKIKIPNWISAGKKLMYCERYDDWDKCVEKRVNDIYRGNDLDFALQIMKALDEGATIDEARKIFEKQCHIGTTKFVVRDIVFAFSPKGPEFWEATVEGKISPRGKQMIEDKKKENEMLSKSNPRIAEKYYDEEPGRHL